jgi:hypothetical protein
VGSRTDALPTAPQCDFHALSSLRSTSNSDYAKPTPATHLSIGWPAIRRSTEGLDQGVWGPGEAPHPRPAVTKSPNAFSRRWLSCGGVGNLGRPGLEVARDFKRSEVAGLRFESIRQGGPRWRPSARPRDVQDGWREVLRSQVRVAAGGAGTSVGFCMHDRWGPAPGFHAGEPSMDHAHRWLCPADGQWQPAHTD